METLLRQLQLEGFTISTDGQDLLIQPADRPLSEAWRNRLIAHKPALVSLLTARQVPPADGLSRSRQAQLNPHDGPVGPVQREQEDEIQPALQGFERQVLAAPAAIALQFHDRCISYAQLNEAASLLAAQLTGLGIKKGDRTALFLSRSAELLVCVLALHKTGAVMVPLDTSFPKQRLLHMCSQAAVRFLLTQNQLEGDLPGLPCRVIKVRDMDFQQPATAAAEPFRHTAGSLSGSDTACIMFTSGSSGAPKGVEVSHASLANTLEQVTQLLDITRDDCFLGLANIAFDIALFELLGPLLRGARLALLDDRQCKDLAGIAARLHSGQVSVVQATPSLWKLLNAHDWQQPGSGLKLIATGEPLPTELAQELLRRNGSLWNLYGPTEAAIWTTGKHLAGLAELDPHQPYVSIGKPLRNTVCRILDESLVPVRQGELGELYIGGRGLAKGYTNEAALSRRKFIASPVPGIPGNRLYGSGDLVRERSNGEIEFCQRSDRQVKVNGYRVQLEEIEGELKRHPSIQDALVKTAYHSRSGGKLILAYLVPEPDTPNKTSTVLNQYLALTLPHYMLPARYYYVAGFPLTASGKVDYQALPVPQQREAENRQAEALNPVELKVADIFCEVLELDHVGVYDSFFDAGGNSMLAASLLLPINAEYGLDIKLRELLSVPPTVNSLSLLIQQHLHRAGCAHSTFPLPVQVP